MHTQTQALDKHFGRRRWRKQIERSAGDVESFKAIARTALDKASRGAMPYERIDVSAREGQPGYDGKPHTMALSEVIAYLDLGYIVPVWREMKNDWPKEPPKKGRS